MDRKYAKVVHEKLDESLSLEDAIKSEEYCTNYFLDETTIGRIDYYEPGFGLVKVSYRQVSPPLDAVVSEHFRVYPDALCEVFTPTERGNDKALVVHTYLFQPPGLLDSRYELHYDPSGRVERRIKLGENGERVSEENERYDITGQWVSTTTLDASGQAIREYHRDDD